MALSCLGFCCCCLCVFFCFFLGGGFFQTFSERSVNHIHYREYKVDWSWSISCSLAIDGLLWQKKDDCLTKATNKRRVLYAIRNSDKTSVQGFVLMRTSLSLVLHPIFFFLNQLLLWEMMHPVGSFRRDSFFGFFFWRSPRLKYNVSAINCLIFFYALFLINQLWGKNLYHLWYWIT